MKIDGVQSQIRGSLAIFMLRIFVCLFFSSNFCLIFVELNKSSEMCAILLRETQRQNEKKRKKEKNKH